MERKVQEYFSEKTLVFRERRLPELATPIGYAALIEAYKLCVPLPRTLRAISEHHKIYTKDNWEILTPRHYPENSLEGHLVFALKHEGIDLGVLKKLFEKTEPAALEEMVSSKPTSAYTRKIWFLYEWLLGKKLSLSNNASVVKYVDLIDTQKQYAITGKKSPRHKIRNNLPGLPGFCPLVFKTEKIENFINKDLSLKAKESMGHVSKDILARTAAFLLLKDSKSSYAIEGESTVHTRIQRWGKAIGEAGKQPLDLDELLRLQKIVIGDARFIELGLRKEGGFIGEHEQTTRLPLPDHISANADDLKSLIENMIGFYNHSLGEIDPVILAAIIAFSFVYIHPFVDGNGRIHRYLIHHVLAQSNFAPSGMVFPVSAAILERLDDYRRVLESYSKKLLPLVDYRPTESMNIEVLNDTADYYRYFDATLHVEFLYECVEKTINVDLPQEINFLKNYDSFKRQVESIIEMPPSTIDLLFNFLKQNNGKLSKRALSKEFTAFTEQEVLDVEKIYSLIFETR